LPQISGTFFAFRTHQRGVRVVTDVGAECGGRFGGARRAAREADGEIVWSWRPDAGAKSAMMLRITLVTVANKPGTPGRPRISRKTIAQGRPDDPAYTCGNYRVLTTNAHGPRVRRAPGFPCALCFPRDFFFRHSSGAWRREKVE